MEYSDYFRAAHRACKYAYRTGLFVGSSVTTLVWIAVAAIWMVLR